MVTCVYDGNDTGKSLLGNSFQRYTVVVPTDHGFTTTAIYLYTVAALIPGLRNVTNLESCPIHILYTGIHRSWAKYRYMPLSHDYSHVFIPKCQVTM